MEVKGTAFLARKMMLIDELGEEGYARIIQEIAQKEPIFEEPILATTLIPMRSFIELNELLIRTLYKGDPKSYYLFGERSAEYGLTIGPYKRIRDTNSISAFVESARCIYQGYYTAGRAEGSLCGSVAELRILGIPPEDRHIYLEFASAGYVRRGIELIGLHSVSMDRVCGFSNGDDLIHYRYTIEKTPAPAPFSLRHH